MIALTAETFTSTVAVANSGVCIVCFTAPRCAPCRPVVAGLETLTTAYRNVGFFTVNVELFEHLANRYGIVSVPTVVFFVNGEPVSYLRGSKAVKSAIDKALQQLGAKRS